MLNGLKKIALSLLVLIAVPAMATTADPFLQTAPAPVEVQLAGGGLTLQQAAAKARQQQGGKVVKAETRSSNGKPVHHIRIVKDGRVKTLIFDAATGKKLQ